MNYNEYLMHLNASDEVVGWVNTTLKKRLGRPNPPEQGQIEHVLDYLCSEQGPKKLKRMSYEQAHKKAEAWVKTMQKHGRDIVERDVDVETLHNFADGSRIVKLIGQSAFQREAFFMSHCVASYFGRTGVEIYSYRDAKNEPHATFEVVENGGLQQIKGKGNGPIHPRYIEPILSFLEILGKRPRPSEMVYLGYYHVDDSQVDLLNSLYSVRVRPHKLFGHSYLYQKPTI